jgi:hypothetical protein
MRFTLRNFLIFSSFLVLLAGARGQVNPHTQIRWPGACSAPGMVYNFQSNTCLNMNAINPATQLAWPASCTSGSMVYSPSINACISNGTANNPAGSSTQAQINNGGVFGGVPVTMDSSGNLAAAAAITGNAIGGTYYAGQYPGQSNNGIALTFADATRCGVSGSGGVGGCTVIAGPAYPTTEQPYSYNFYGMPKFPSASNAFFHDQRQGWNLRLSHDPAKNYFDQNGASSFSDACIYSHINGWSGASGWQTQILGCHNLNFAYANPGLNMGTTNGSSGSGRTGGWTVSQGLAIQGITNSPGITEALSVNDVKAGTGDQTIYFNHWSYNGAVAGSDEGTHILSLGGGEAQDTYIGTVSTGGTGATTIKMGCIADCAYPGDGRYDIDLTKGVALNVVGISQPSGGVPGSFTSDISVTPSTAWGTTSTNIATPTALPLGVGSTSMTFTVNSGPGNTGQFAVGDLICFQADYHEQTKITAVTGTGPWTITAPLRHAHNPGWIMANGMCGQFIDFAANDGGGVHTLHYPVDILGATDAHTLKYNFFSVQGASTIFPTSNIILPSTQTGTWSNTGGLVTIPNASPWGAANPFYGQSSITISGVSDATFNGTCTSVTLGPASLNYPIQCTQASSTGHTVSGTGTISVGTNGYGNTAATLYPGAELLDMQDYNATTCTAAGLTAPCNDGTHTLEPNTVAWTAGDSVENSHHYAAQIGLTRAYINNYNGWANAAGRLDMYTGLKSGNLGNLTDSYQAYQIQNNTPWANHYSYHGGGRNPPGGFLLGGATNGEGVWNWGLAMTYAPDPVNSSALWIGCPASGCSDPNYYYYVFSNQYNGGTISQPAGLRFTPSTARYQLIGGIDSLSMFNPAVISSANGTAASQTYTSIDSGAATHKWTITAPLTGGGFTETWPQSSGTIINSSNVLIASGASHAAGLAPDPGSTAGTTRYLREDATWQTPPTSAPYLQGTTQVIGGTSNAVSMGDYTNLVPWSTDLVHSGAWTLGGFVSATGGQSDPWPGGTTATQLTTNGGPSNYQSTTTTTTATTYCVSSWMKGNAGGEQVGLYIGGAVSSNVTLTTSWVRYSASITTAGTQGAGWHQFGSTVTFFVAGLQVNLGACSAAIPAYTPTVASAITTPIPAVQTPTLLNGSSTITVPNTTGTMALTSQLPVKISTSITPAAATASSCVEQTFTFTGLTTAQGVHVSPPASLGAHIWIGETRVSASNTLAIAFCADATAGTPPAGTYIAVAF